MFGFLSPGPRCPVRPLILPANAIPVVFPPPKPLSCYRETAAPSGTNYSCLGDLGLARNNSNIAANF